MRALVITGLFNFKGAQYIQEDLEAKGYIVEVHSWRSTKIDYNQNYDVVIGHSAGSVQAQIYAHHHPDVPVFILGAPIDVNLPNVTNVGQQYDPVSRLDHGDVDKFTGGFVHSKDAYYDAIKASIPVQVLAPIIDEKYRSYNFGE